jgi:curved DNA-binding protein CbpA
VLEVPRRTTDEAVRAAWVELAKRTHPDRYRESSDAVRQLAEEAFRIVSEAYETIASSERRLEYLRALRNRDHEAAELEEGQRALRAELEFQKGQGCLQRKDYSVAVQHFERAMRTYPEEGEYQAHFGWAFYLAGPDEPGRLREAIEHVLAGRKLAPDREKPYLFLGWLYKASGRVQIAERMFHRALQLDPDCVEAIRELRLIDMRRQRSRGLVRRILRR